LVGRQYDIGAAIAQRDQGPVLRGVVPSAQRRQVGKLRDDDPLAVRAAV
jgi:hypothetical protein